MKKLLIGLLVLGSISVFADCEVTVKSLETGKVFTRSFDTRNGIFTLLSIDEDLKLNEKVNLTVRRTSANDLEAAVHVISGSKITLNDEIDLTHVDGSLNELFKDQVDSLILRLSNGSGDRISNDKFRLGAICDAGFRN